MPPNIKFTWIPLFHSLFAISILFLSYAITAADNSTYTAEEVFLISCGAVTNAGKVQDGREWHSDVGSKVQVLNMTASSVAKASLQDSSVPSVPFMTARIFTGPVTYSFQVARLAAQRRFVRLYFYPTAYDNRSASDAVFDVSATYDAGFHDTLLRNFSPALNVEAQQPYSNTKYIVQEYSLNVSEAGFLNLTFTPSKQNAGSYAFVNGIEVVSIPDIFPAENDVLTKVGLSNFDLNRTAALETLYRLNVGGAQVSRVEDSGLFRQWDVDDPYILGSASELTHTNDSDVPLRYPQATPRYIAPDAVYKTQRSMTGVVAINKESNLTWLFTVDPGFYYLVRLHFCDIQSNYNKPNERVFSIYINNMTAEGQADVFAWASLLVGSVQQGSGLGVPFYKDYVTIMPNGPEQVDLRLDLHPNEGTLPEYVDAVLNGLELFKINNASDRNLAGVTPSPMAVNRGASLPKRSSKGCSRTSCIAGVLGGALALIICGLLLLFFVSRKCMKQRVMQEAQRHNSKPKLIKETSTLLQMSPLTNSDSTRTGSTLPSNVCRHFTFAEIEDATRGFDDSMIIGVGGFGRVYMGVVRAGESLASPLKASPAGNGLEVAIKRANPTSQQGLREFRNEIEMLSKLRHKHLVSLIGFCDESTEMILVYDFMSNGTLREHLYNKTGKPTLGWQQRLQVCIGAARGLHYLHTGAQQTIIHRDVKTTNILLNEAWEAKVADFGLSKAGPDMEHDSHVSTEVKGSFGYLDPEYYRRRKLTEKSDVYSFGVVLFEVLCGRPAVNQNLPKEQANLADWARLCYKKGVLKHIIDPVIKGKIAPKCFVTFAEIAERCTADRGVDRPAMQDVLWSLEFALQQQEYAQADGSWEGEGEAGEEDSRYSPLLSTPGTGVTQDTATSTTNSASYTSSVNWARNDSVPFTPSAIFSEIGDPKGR